jgi:hypothetical protein
VPGYFVQPDNPLPVFSPDERINERRWHVAAEGFFTHV